VHAGRVEWRLGRRRGLDGLRGVAILLVVACHLLGKTVGPPDQYLSLGRAGVTLFFTLSGFLITSVLVEDVSARGRVSLAGFYRNRAVRLFPALAVLIASLALLQRASGQQQLLNDTWAVLLYVGNWAIAAGGSLGLLDITWSLAIEEQFYLVWPLVLVVALRWQRGPVNVVISGIIASTAIRFVLAPHELTRVAHGSDTQAGSLLFGCLLALAAHRGLRAWRCPSWVPAVGAFSLVGWGLFGGLWSAAVLVPTIVGPFGALLIWWAVSTSGGPLEWSWLRYLGRRSYALYLWHEVALAFFLGIAGGSLAAGILAVGVAVCLAEASWRLVERPARRLRALPLPTPSLRPATAG
jgi:peptidoglycan/LPS O-acetylase OafA/YrhL